MTKEELKRFIKERVSELVRETYWGRAEVTACAVYHAAQVCPQAGAMLIIRIAKEEASKQISPLAVVFRWYKRTY